jgi:hypothetical protein
MPVFGSQMFGSAAAGAPEPLDVGNSCLFAGSNSAYMTFLPSSTTNDRTWTVSFWWKFVNKASNKNDMAILSASSTHLFFSSSDNKFNVTDGTTYRKTSATFTDAAEWHHMVVAVDSTNGVAADRIKVYYDGAEITSWTTNNAPSLNFDFDVCSDSNHRLGRYTATSNYFWGYLSEFYIIDGAQKAAEDFGVENDDGDWVPIAYSGSYGTNGCYLDFADSGNLGDDESGNGNDFTETNIDSGDQYISTPSSNRGTLNPYTGTAVGYLSAATISEGNTAVTQTASSLSGRAPGTFKISSGKFYWEAKYTGTVGGQDYGHMGIWDSDTALPAGNNIGGGNVGSNEWIFSDNGDKNHDSTTTSGPSGNWAVNDIIQIAVDLTANKLWFGRNNTWQGAPASGTGQSFSSIGDNIVPIQYGYGGGSGQGNWAGVNYGGKAFTYTPPSGFEAPASDNSQGVTLGVAPTQT